MKDSNYLSRIKLEFTKSRNKYRIGTRTTYKGRGIPMNIGKSKDNFDKDGKPRYFNYNIYGHMVKKCWRSKKEKDTRKCYKYNKVGYLARDCRSGQKIKNRSI